MNKDELLLQSVPPGTKIHKVKALSKKWTIKIGLGSLGLRSLWFYYTKVNRLLKAGHYDLVYFSTTQFPVCILGAFWKKKFNIPYVIDMQDPWHSEYYQGKSKEQQPKKYWFSYRLNKHMEPMAIKQVDGLISVSENYITDLKNRYPEIQNIPAATITFGAFEPDVEIALINTNQFENLLYPGHTSIVYVGRGGADMHQAIAPVFKVLKQGISNSPEIFKRFKFYFIGTSYAPVGTGNPTIMPLAEMYGIEDYVIEITDRIGYYHALSTLQQADALFIAGSDDPNYSASKIYPYLLSGKPLLTIFNSKSPVVNILKELNVQYNYTYDATTGLEEKIAEFLNQPGKEIQLNEQYSKTAMEKYSAFTGTKHQCNLFDKVLNAKN